MKTSQWIKDVKTVIGCEVPELFHVLAKIADREEDSGRGLFARKCQSKILECLENVKIFLGEIRRNAQDFTLHDIQHCINVIDFMGQMLVDVESLNPAEISFFIYAALLHDIGMVKLLDEDISLDDLREDHGNRSARFIHERVLVNNDGTPFSFGEYNYIYMEYLPSICASHMQEFSFVEKLPQSYILDGMEVDMSLCAILLRVADAMDLKHNRAPYLLYQFLINRSVSPEHWKKHMLISNCQVNERGVYRVDGICHDEAVHRCLYNHLDSVESEIEKVFKWKNGSHPRLRLSSHLVHRNVETDGYKMWHHSFEMDVLKITNLFMGEQLYGDRKLGLREILQNSIDACLVREEINKSLDIKQDYTYEPKIYIIFDWENNQIIIRDNGTGMNDYIIENFFLNIGASYYSSKDFKEKNLKYSPLGFFGIGFLATFMLSDDVYVRTSHWQEDVEYEFHFIKSDRFVTKTERQKTFSGTEIRLNLEQFIEIFDARGTLNFTDISLIQAIGRFIDSNFWNLDIAHLQNNVMLFKKRNINFIEYAKLKLYRNYYEDDFLIDLSEYLIDIEGIIHLRSSEVLGYIKNSNGIGKPNFLDAIKKGEINISDNIRESFPLIKHFYEYDDSQKQIYEIEANDYIHFRQFILFPIQKSKYYNFFNSNSATNMEDFEVSQFNYIFYNMNCLCLTKSYMKDNSEFINYKKIYEPEKYLSNKLFNKLCEYLGYKPFFLIIINGLNDMVSGQMTYNNFKDKSTHYNNVNSRYWIKQVKIDIAKTINQPINFNLLNIENILVRISNYLIIPDSSRRFIVDSSATKLMHAISVCIYLWIYDQVKADKEAIFSKEYLKQLIVKEWNDSVKGLLRLDKKPI